MKTVENETPRHPEHEFTLILTGVDGRDDEVYDALFEAGCDDAVFSYRQSMYRLNFGREAPSLRDAIISAIKDVHKNTLGVGVRRVDSCNLVMQSEIARKLGISRSMVSLHVAGKRGATPFPPPVCSLGDQALWAWCEVACWARRNGLMTDQDVIDAQDLELINIVLDYSAAHRGGPAVFDAMMDEIARTPDVGADQGCEPAHN
jgi:hypothetical protein